MSKAFQYVLSYAEIQLHSSLVVKNNNNNTKILNFELDHELYGVNSFITMDYVRSRQLIPLNDNLNIEIQSHCR